MPLQLLHIPTALMCPHSPAQFQRQYRLKNIMNVRKAHQAAQYILVQAVNSGELLTNVKMQNLIYYAYAHALALTNIPLFDDVIRAFEHGPVVPALYLELKSEYGAGPIGVEFLDPYTLDTAEHELECSFEFGQIFAIDSVCDHYMPLSARTLSNKIHEDPLWNKKRNAYDKTIYAHEFRSSLAATGLALQDPSTDNEASWPYIEQEEQFVRSTLRGLEDIESDKTRKVSAVMQSKRSGSTLACYFSSSAAENASGFSQTKLNALSDAIHELCCSPIPDEEAKHWMDALPLLSKHKFVAVAKLGGFYISYKLQRRPTAIYIAHIFASSNYEIWAFNP